MLIETHPIFTVPIALLYELAREKLYKAGIIPSDLSIFLITTGYAKLHYNGFYMITILYEEIEEYYGEKKDV